LRIDPAAATIAIGAVVAFAATAVYADGSKRDVTASATWSVDDSTVADVAGGLVDGVGAGSTLVRASFGRFTAQTSVVIVAKTITLLQIAPPSPTIGVGTTFAFQAIAIWSDGTHSDVTASATWSTSTAAVASISVSGVAKGISAGSTLVTAAFSGQTAQATLSVTAASVTGISVVPLTATLAVGAIQVLIAKAAYSDGTVVDVTTSALWSTSDATIATVSGFGVATANGVGTASITASFGGTSGIATITISPANLLSIAIVPGSATISVGSAFPFKASGTYSDSRVVDVTMDVVWSTDDATVASVGNGAAGSSGVVTPVAAGKTTLRASLNGISASSSIAVTSASVDSITITPSTPSVTQGGQVQLTAKARLSGGTTEDVTASCIWTTGDATIAAVSGGSTTAGQVTGVGVGSTTIACTFRSATGTATVTVTSATLTQVNVSPVAPKCHAGDAIQFTAMAIANDGTSTNVTKSATWTSSDATIVKALNTTGHFQCITGGSATISASYGGQIGWTPVTVLPGALTGVQLSPVDSTIAVGWTQQFVATALYSDGTSETVTGASTWISSDTTVAQVDDASAKGRTTGLASGSIAISATYRGLVGSTMLTVSSATISSISIFPASRSVAVGTVVQFRASAIYSDGTSKDVTGIATWTSSSPGVAQVSDGVNKGQATALSHGSATISATWGGVTGKAAFTVTAATLSSIQVTPFTASSAVGQPVYFRAVAIYSDGTKGDITSVATWQSSDSTIAQVSNAYWWSRGRTTTLATGTASISASYGGMTGSASLTVTSATLQRIQITPFNPTLPAGFGIQLQATGVYSDGTTTDLTAFATWQTSDGTVAAVSNVWPSWGRLQPLSTGPATISATFQGVTGSDLVTVSSATLTSIAIAPNPANVAVQTSLALTATGTFSDGSTLDVTGYVTWLSSDVSIADVSNASGSRGLAYGFTTGTVAVSAVYGKVNGTSALSVQ
jgi:uncharacterized protein YjdB